MTNGYDYSQYTAGMEVSAKEAYRLKDGAGGKGIFIPEVMENIQEFKPSLGIKFIDIIMAPAGSRHPLVVSGKISQGTPTHITWVYVHKNVGQDWWVCLARTYGQRCPFCEHRTKLQADPDIPKETYNLYGSGKYALGIYKMVNHLNSQQITWQEPVMVWPINFSFMESTLQSMAKQPFVTEEVPSGYINYMSPLAGPQGGRHIKFEIKPKGQYYDYDGHQFFVRQHPVPGHIMDMAKAMPPVDELVYVPEYEEMMDALQVSLDQPAGGQPTGETYGGIGEAQQYQEYGGGQAAPQPFGTPEDRCPFSDYEGVLGVTFDKFQECGSCQFKVKCQSTSPQQAPTGMAPTAPTPMAPTPAAPTPTVNPVPTPAGGTASPTVRPIPRRPQR